MLANGASTLWESWKKPESSSYNHPMFGSVDEWFYKSLAGIQSAAPGFKKIVIKPQPATLAWADASYQSMYGTIKSKWKKMDSSFELEVSIPVNTTAEVWLPAKENQRITESGKLITSFDDLKLQGYKNGYAVLTVGSGDYHFLVSSH